MPVHWLIVTLAASRIVSSSAFCLVSNVSSSGEKVYVCVQKREREKKKIRVLYNAVPCIYTTAFRVARMMNASTSRAYFWNESDYG